MHFQRNSGQVRLSGKTGVKFDFSMKAMRARVENRGRVHFFGLATLESRLCPRFRRKSLSEISGVCPTVFSFADLTKVWAMYERKLGSECTLFER